MLVQGRQVAGSKSCDEEDAALAEGASLASALAADATLAEGKQGAGLPPCDEKDAALAEGIQGASLAFALAGHASLVGSKQGLTSCDKQDGAL